MMQRMERQIRRADNFMQAAYDMAMGRLSEKVETAKEAGARFFYGSESYTADGPLRKELQERLVKERMTDFCLDYIGEKTGLELTKEGMEDIQRRDQIRRGQDPSYSARLYRILSCRPFKEQDDTHRDAYRRVENMIDYQMSGYERCERGEPRKDDNILYPMYQEAGRHLDEVAMGSASVGKTDDTAYVGPHADAYQVMQDYCREKPGFFTIDCSQFDAPALSMDAYKEIGQAAADMDSRSAMRDLMLDVPVGEENQVEMDIV